MSKPIFTHEEIKEGKITFSYAKLSEPDKKNFKSLEKYDYSKLSDLAKVKARKGVIFISIEALNKDKEIVKSLLRENIHVLVNSRCHISNLLSQSNLINKLLNDQGYFEKVIEENLCNFFSDGTYITYCI